MINFDLDKAVTSWRLQISELEEVQNEAYENVKIAKVQMKKFHEQYIVRKILYPFPESLTIQFKAPPISWQVEV